MTDVRGLTQSVLQTTQVDRVQDAQQRQVSVDQRAGAQQFSQRVDQRRSQVNLAERVEHDPLQPYEGGTEGGPGGTGDPEAEGEEQPEELLPEDAAAADSQEAGRAPGGASPTAEAGETGRHVDIKA